MLKYLSRRTHALWEPSKRERFGRADLSFGPLLATDLPEVWKMERQSSPTPWPASLFQDLMGDPRHTVLGARLGRRVVGYLAYEERGKVCHLANFCVHPGFRARGVGTAMMEYLTERLCDEEFKMAELEVRESNLPAQLFYKKLGFAAEAVIQGFYFDTLEDGFLMRKALPERLNHGTHSGIRQA